MLGDHLHVRTQPLTDAEGALSGEDILPLGSGRAGGVLWMPEGRFCLQLNHTQYWRGGSEVPASHLEFGGRPVSIGRLFLSREGGFGTEAGTFRQELRLEDAICNVEIDRGDGQTRLNLFYDMDRDLLVVRWRESGQERVQGAIELAGWRETVSARVSERTCLLEEQAAPTRVPHEEEYLAKLTGGRAAGGSCAQATAMALMSGGSANAVDGHRCRIHVEGMDGFDVVLVLATVVDTHETDLADRALALVAEARDEGYKALAERHTRWWSEFWQKSHVSLSSSDGSAERFVRHWYVLNYLMAVSNRGRWPVKFNHGNWLTGTDDKRDWGGGYWYYNERDFVLAMMAANHLDLADNLYTLYLDATANLKAQTQHLFGHGGVFVPETVSRDGAMFHRDRRHIYTGHTKFIQLIFSTGLEVAYNLYQLGRYRGDEGFLRDKAYPFMREVVRFFQIHMYKDSDGVYHLYPANAHETWWRLKDNMCDLSGLRACLPILIELSKEFGVDEQNRAEWTEFLANLAPLPRGRLTFEGNPEWEDRGDGAYGLNCHAVAVDRDADAYTPGEFMHDSEMHNCHPTAVWSAYPFQLSHVGSEDRQTATNTYMWNTHRFERNCWAADAIVPAMLGMKEEMVPALSAFAEREWGSSLTYIERYSKVGMAVTLALLQSHHGVIRLFPTLPDGWSGSFKLLAEGPFLVEATAENGVAAGATITSLREQKITIVNPWPGRAVTVTPTSGGPELLLEGDTLSWSCRKQATYTVAPSVE